MPGEVLPGCVHSKRECWQESLEMCILSDCFLCICGVCVRIPRSYVLKAGQGGTGLYQYQHALSEVRGGDRQILR